MRRKEALIERGSGTDAGELGSASFSSLLFFARWPGKGGAGGGGGTLVGASLADLPENSTLSGEEGAESGVWFPRSTPQ